MQEFEPGKSTNDNKLEGEVSFGPYRPVAVGESVREEGVVSIVQDGIIIPHIPIRIYGIPKEDEN